jgi:hypothetical protein
MKTILRVVTLLLFAAALFGQSTTQPPAVDAHSASGGQVSTTDTITGMLTVTNAAQPGPQIVLAGQEFYQAGTTTGDGLTFLLGVNRTNNRQLWLADPTKLTQNSTNTVLRLVVGDQQGDLSAIATDGLTGKPLVLNGAGGNVGIGGNPTSKLTTFSGASQLWAFHAQQSSQYSANTAAYDRGGTGVVYTTVDAGVTNSGNSQGWRGASWLYGAGTLASTYAMFAEANVAPGNSGSITNAYSVYTRVKKNDGVIGNGYGVFIEDVTATNDYGIYQAGADDSNYFGGEVTIGSTGPISNKLTVNGNVNVTGSITGATVIGAVYQDVAEWVPATEEMAPGTVVTLDLTRKNHVMPSSQPYDTAVAGVVSAQPGVILGVGGPSREQIATTGRVLVRVDATKRPVQIGDLLVTSDRSGMAMVSEPLDINGRRFHQPGTIIGKALEPLSGGEGEILVLLSLQ